LAAAELLSKAAQTGRSRIRTRRLDGDVVIDTLLANRAALTGQTDLFWAPVGNDPFARRITQSSPKQMRLL
jgi:hypothetical protein